MIKAWQKEDAAEYFAVATATNTAQAEQWAILLRFAFSRLGWRRLLKKAGENFPEDLAVKFFGSL